MLGHGAGHVDLAYHPKNVFDRDRDKSRRRRAEERGDIANADALYGLDSRRANVRRRRSLRRSMRATAIALRK